MPKQKKGRKRQLTFEQLEACALYLNHNKIK